jgi:hypothetical protein
MQIQATVNSQKTIPKKFARKGKQLLEKSPQMLLTLPGIDSVLA